MERIPIPKTRHPISAEGTPYMNDTVESWKPVPGYEGLYEVSDQGRMVSMPRKGTRGGLLTTWLDTAGYPSVTLHAGSKPATATVHRLMMAAFIGPQSSTVHIRHLDGNPQNCTLANLAYGTMSQNTLDMVRHGTHNQASKTHCPSGHDYDEANTLRINGRRQCRTCARDRARAYAARMRLLLK